MAYREIGMWEILEVLRRVARGERRRAIERVTGRSRSTIRRWLRVARKLGWEPGQGEPDESLAVAVAQRVRPVREEASPGASQARLLPHREQIQAWLAPEEEHRGLRLTKVQQLLTRKGVDVPYSSLHRFAVQHCGFADRRRLTVRRAETAPGELAEVDFGRLGLVWDPEAERRRVHHALLVTLVYSRHQYIYVTPSQKIPDLIAGLEEAWAFFGGVTTRVVLDNLKAAVTKADRYDPIFERTFAEYAAHRGFVIDAAVARHATGKPVVERNVQYVRESFFRGEDVARGRDHVQRDARPLVLGGRRPGRVHGTTRTASAWPCSRTKSARCCVPLVAPGASILRSGPRPRSIPDHHIQFAEGVSTRFADAPCGQAGVTVRGDSKLVRHLPRPASASRRTSAVKRRPALDRLSRLPRRARSLCAPRPRCGDPRRSIARASPHRSLPREAARGRLPLGQAPSRPRQLLAALQQVRPRAGRCRLPPRRVLRALQRPAASSRSSKHELERDGTTSPVAPRGQLVLLPARFLRPAQSFTHPQKETPRWRSTPRS